MLLLPTLQYITPGGALNNFNTTAPTAGLTPSQLTKAATWSGFTGAGGAHLLHYTLTTTPSPVTPSATYGNANLANITYGAGANLNGVAGGAASS